ncbi:hypothetical protein [Streptomyces rubiginosohelvolus]|uniref:hypothetical protein n=1 Tax=Streptomyces rubiginosohelvolus TaxID=67362 RepID=UPI00372267BF
MLFSAAADFTPQFEIRGWEIRPRVLLGILAGLAGWAGLLYALRAPGVQGVLASPENALHLAAVITGVLLLQVRHWAPKKRRSGTWSPDAAAISSVSRPNSQPPPP